jgi:hypothetical protein
MSSWHGNNKEDFEIVEFSLVESQRLTSTNNFALEDKKDSKEKAPKAKSIWD